MLRLGCAADCEMFHCAKTLARAGLRLVPDPAARASSENGGGHLRDRNFCRGADARACGCTISAAGAGAGDAAISATGERTNSRSTAAIGDAHRDGNV